MSTDPTTPKLPAQPLTLKHETQPTWGVGLVVQDLPSHWVIFFENAGEKKFVKAMAKVLTQVKLEADELAALQKRATARKPKAGFKPSANFRSVKKKPAAKKSSGPRYTKFEEQLAVFERLFAGGFQGETYVKKEREPREAAIALAQLQLTAASFASEPPAEMFQRAQAVLSATDIVFPIEGPIPFKLIVGEDQVKTAAGLKDALHGAGAYGERLQRFAASINLKDSKGVAKKVSWPLATVFGALFDPKQHTCVKPTAFAAQAALLGIALQKTQALDAAGYALFLEVATRTQALLREAGAQPRDLLDVYTFIWRTHADKVVAAEAV
ncbi:MAG: hypothetical protein Q8N23_11615 [Archangium sp.]|nr:hypothetical protein [Archangium sp.]MDP3153313.1 hypothetical protein [Archangium sp.]MDP3573379.1 hypothetical protein [Archangium sp.]